MSLGMKRLQMEKHILGSPTRSEKELVSIGGSSRIPLW